MITIFNHRCKKTIIFLVCIIKKYYFCKNYHIQTDLKLDLNTIHRYDDKALRMLYRHFYKALVAFVCQMVEDTAVAEEIVQDAFVKLWQLRNTFKSVGTLKAYLYNTVRNASISHLRHQQVEARRIAEYERDYQLMASNDDVSVEMHREELMRQLLTAIEALPPKQRQLFLLAVKGKTGEEIAEEMGISIDGVKKQRQRGLARLRESLQPDAFLLLLLLLEKAG